MKKFSLLLGLVAVSMFVIGCGEPQTTGSGSNNTQEEEEGMMDTTMQHTIIRRSTAVI